MSEVEARFSVLAQSSDPDVVEAIRSHVRSAPDRELSRINVLDFAARHGLNEERTIAGFLHSARLGLFDLSWNILCPGCSGVLDSNASLKTIDREKYACALCAAGYEPSLDDVVEVAFTVSPRVRAIAAHTPETLPFVEYFRQIFWSSGISLPDDFEALVERVTLDRLELPPGEKMILSLHLPAEFLIVFDPVTHASHFLDVKGEPTRERQNLTVVFNNVQAPTGTLQLRPGPLRLTLENDTEQRVLPGIWIAGHDLHDLLGNRKRFLTAKRLLTNQVFRDIYRTGTMEVDQRLKITSLTFLFTDLKGSTELYERVGDLEAYDLVRAHFRILTEVVVAEAGAVVKTIGDAVMATFPSPDRALAAALRMRDAIQALNAARGREDVLLKIGLHEGSCLAVTLNDRLDYFGQTVNIAARVQGLAMSRSIFATGPIVENPQSRQLLDAARLEPMPQRHALKGIADEFLVYEIA